MGLKRHSIFFRWKTSLQDWANGHLACQFASFAVSVAAYLLYLTNSAYISRHLHSYLVHMLFQMISINLI